MIRRFLTWYRSHPLLGTVAVVALWLVAKNVFQIRTVRSTTRSIGSMPDGVLGPPPRPEDYE